MIIRQMLLRLSVLTLFSAFSAYAATITESGIYSGNIKLKAGVHITGDVTTTSGWLRLKQNSSISGNASATQNINLEFNTSIGGNVVTTGGSVTLDQNAEIGGSADATGNINLGYESLVGGAVTTDGKVTLDQNAEIGSDVSATENISLGYNASVGGTVTTDGALMLEGKAEINGDATAMGDIGLGQEASVGGTVTTDGALMLEGKAEINGDATAMGDIGLGQEASVGGTVTTDGALTLDEKAKIDGDATAMGDIDLGQESSVEGNVVTTSNSGDTSASGTISLAYKASVGGSVTTDGALTLEQEAVINGDATAVGDINLAYKALVGGSVTTDGALKLEQEAIIDGDVTVAGDINLAYKALVAGNVTTTDANGQLTLEQGGVISGDVIISNINSSFTINMGYQAEIKGDVYYCGVLNGSYSKEPVCEKDPEPVLLLHLDEIEVGKKFDKFIDTSGNGLYGEIKNGATNQAANPSPARVANELNMGTCGYAGFVRSENNPQYVQIADDSELDIQDNLTISSWIYPTNIEGGLHSILSKDENYEYHINSSGKIYWWWRNSANKERSLTSNTSVSPGEWTHIVIRYSNGNARIYINGVLDNEGPWSDYEKLAINDDPLNIGQDQGVYDRAFNGYIDEVQIFKSALTDQQIEDLYNQRHSCGTETELECFSDDFNTSSLSSDWVTSSSGTNEFIPQIVGGRLRFTEAENQQATSSTYLRLFPAADNRVEIYFEQFAYGGNGADGIALVLSDSSVTPQAGAFGGPLGYGAKSGISGFAGGWLGIGIDEFGNFSNEGSPNVKDDGPGRRRQSIVLRGSGSGTGGYRYLAGTCENGTDMPGSECLNPDIDENSGNPLHKYKIVIDSQTSGHSDVEVFRMVGNSDWKTIIEKVNILDFNEQAPVPTNFYFSVTGSTGGSTNVHEIDNFKICAANSSEVGELVDHFRFVHDGSGVTCNAETVTLIACADSDCSTRFTDEVTVSLSPDSDVVWSVDDSSSLSGAEVTFSGGEATLLIRKTAVDDSSQSSTITLSTTGSTPATKPLSTTICNSNDDSSFSTGECDLTFYDAGFEVNVPDKIANSSVGGYIQAIQTSSTDPQQCEPLEVTGGASVKLWSSYITPDSDSVIGTPVISVSEKGEDSFNSVSTDSGAPSTHSLEFDATGKAEFDLKYADAGKLQLSVKYTGTGDDAGLELDGSDQFVSVPERLEVTAEAKTSRNYDSSAADNAYGKERPGDVFTEAGADFDLTVTAYGKDDEDGTAVPTPNYSQTNMKVITSLVAPLTGTLGELEVSDGNLTTTETEAEYSYTHVPDPESEGENLLHTSYSEVGQIKITVEAGTKYTISGKQYPTDGKVEPDRFTPDYLEVTEVQGLEISDGCDDSGFSYIGQPLNVSTTPTLKIQGMSATGSETMNYQIGSWWKYDGDWEGRSYTSTPSGNAVVETSDSESVVVSDYISDETRTVQLKDAELTYTKPATAVEPLDDLITLKLEDTHLTDSDGICYRDSSGYCTGFNFTPTAYHNHRWGRLVMEDTYGPETSPLQATVQTEYYLNGIFVLNSDDQCTNIGLGDLSFEVEEVAQSYDAISVGSSTTAASIGQQPGTDGEGYISYTAPGSGNQGTVNVTADLGNVPWLVSYDSDDDDVIDSSDNDTIDATVQFGVYRGSDRIIWWTEQLD